MPEDDDRALFATTRGKLLLLMCRGPRTVNELATELGVTDNAVRAQLTNLQEEELVRIIGLRPGTRKPHVDYELTPKARLLFPGAHEPVLRTLVEVLQERLEPGQTRSLLKEAARRLFVTWVGQLRESRPERRAGELLEKLKDLAPGIMLEDAGHFQVRACGCPLASLTAAHPGVCELLSEVLGDLLGTPVYQRCDRSETPRCCFELARSATL